ncbi:hypothetical protein AMTR_s00040p00147480, partial [Amborella trichopoda]
MNYVANNYTILSRLVANHFGPLFSGAPTTMYLLAPPQPVSPAPTTCSPSCSMQLPCHQGHLQPLLLGPFYLLPFPLTPPPLCRVLLEYVTEVILGDLPPSLPHPQVEVIVDIQPYNLCLQHVPPWSMNPLECTLVSLRFCCGT